MYATITVLRFTTEEGRRAAVDGLSVLLQEARGMPGFLGCWVMHTGPRESAMFTLYSSEAAAKAAGARMRPQLASALGAHVAGPPERRAGVVVAASTNGGPSS